MWKFLPYLLHVFTTAAICEFVNIFLTLSTFLLTDPSSYFRSELCWYMNLKLKAAVTQTFPWSWVMSQHAFKQSWNWNKEWVWLRVLVLLCLKSSINRRRENSLRNKLLTPVLKWQSSGMYICVSKLYERGKCLKHWK